MKKTVISALALAASAGLGYAAGVVGPVPPASSLDPKVLKMIAPENLQWRPAEGLQGTEVATLVGNPGQQGFYIQLNRFSPGAFSRPHFHDNDRYIMVVSGTWWVDTGGYIRSQPHCADEGRNLRHAIRAAKSTTTARARAAKARS